MGTSGELLDFVCKGESTGVTLHSIGSLITFTSEANEFKITGAAVVIGCKRLELTVI